MAKMVKCPLCENRFDRETIKFEKVGSRYYHEDCFVEHKKNQKIKEDEKEDKKNAGISGVERQRRDLIDYIMSLYKTTTLNGLVFKQIKDLGEQGYSYIGMQSTLYYFHEIRSNPVIATGIGIIPFVYEEAKSWYTKKAGASKHYDELVKNGMTEITSKRVVKVQSRKLETRLKNKIDITTI